MSLLPSAQKLVERLETQSGLPVHIIEEAGIENLADIKIARGDLQMHVVRYRPETKRVADYLIAYQCGLALRTFELSVERQVDVGGSKQGVERINLLLPDKKLPSSVRGLGQMLLMGLITQLRSYPLGLRVDRVILDKCPDLHQQQVEATRLQLGQNLQAIKATTSGYFPAKVTQANFAMNAAYAAFWAKAWSEPPLTLPYKSAGILGKGEALLKSLEQIPEPAENDCGLIDAWAEELGLRGWYAYVPRRQDQ